MMKAIALCLIVLTQTARVVKTPTPRPSFLIPFTNDSRQVKERNRKLIEAHVFSNFSDDEALTLYTLEYPYCHVAERDHLHDDSAAP